MTYTECGACGYPFRDGSGEPVEKEASDGCPVCFDFVSSDADQLAILRRIAAALEELVAIQGRRE